MFWALLLKGYKRISFSLSFASKKRGVNKQCGLLGVLLQPGLETRSISVLPGSGFWFKHAESFISLQTDNGRRSSRECTFWEFIEIFSWMFAVVSIIFFSKVASILCNAVCNSFKKWSFREGSSFSTIGLLSAACTWLTRGNTKGSLTCCNAFYCSAESSRVAPFGSAWCERVSEITLVLFFY